MSLFLFCLTGLYNTLRLQECDWSKHLSSCLYFMACFCFWHYPWNFELRCCSQQTLPPFCFFVTVFQGTCHSFLISTFRTNFVFLRSKNFKFLHCLGLIDMLSANRNAEIFVSILLFGIFIHFRLRVISGDWLMWINFMAFLLAIKLLV